jgi:peptide/nickel transport system substrate-binding protein
MSKSAQGRRARLSFAAVVGAVGVLLAACGGGGESASGSGSAGAEAKDYSVLNLANSRPTTGWDPAQMLSALEDAWQWSAVYDTLLQCGPGDEPLPGAADEFEVNADNTEVTLHLRDGMTFQDGSAIDSAAAKASIEHARDGGGSVATRLKDMTVAAPDAKTVVVSSPTPQPDLAALFCKAGGIISSPQAMASGDYAVPLSSGPYTYDAAASTSGSVLTFVKRADYWDAQAYPYQKLVISVVPEVTSRLNALQTGQIDGALLNAQTVDAATSAGLGITEWTDAVNGILLFDRDGTMVPALKDARVRQALNMVFDRDAIATGLFQGKAKPTAQMFDAASYAYIPELDQQYKFDVDGAKQLMADAGYADGFTIQIPSRSPQTDQANPLSGRFPATYLSLPMGASPVANVIQSMTPTSTWNVLKNQTPELTALTDQMQTAQGDELTRTVQDINTYVVDNAWFVPWNLRQAYFASNGVTVAPQANPPFNVPQLREFS